MFVVSGGSATVIPGDLGESDVNLKDNPVTVKVDALAHAPTEAIAHDTKSNGSWKALIAHRNQIRARAALGPFRIALNAYYPEGDGGSSTPPYVGLLNL